MHATEFALIVIAFSLWLFGMVCSGLNIRVLFKSIRFGYAVGCVLLLIAIIMISDSGSQPVWVRINLASAPIIFHLTTAALWLAFFGLITATFVCICGTQSKVENSQRFWLFGLGMGLFGAMGVFSLQDSASFLIAWEFMSLGGGVLVLAERLSGDSLKSAFFMLGLLEVGSVAILLALISLCYMSHSLEFSGFVSTSHHLPVAIQFFIGLLFLFGFGAKLGVFPFHEWYPGAYGSASGATGVLFSGLILNAALFALMRALLHWLPNSSSTLLLGIFVSIIGVLSAIIAILFAFQQSDWRRLLSLSSAENANVAILFIGVAIIFRSQNFMDFATMATVVALLHMAAHALAKSALLFMSDGVYVSTKQYRIVPSGILKRSLFWTVGILFAAMSLSAMPPQTGFLSEWLGFQTIFHGVFLHSLASKVTLTLVGVGLALSSAIGFAAYVKVFGVGLLGSPQAHLPIPRRYRVAVAVLGFLVLILAIGLPWWIFVLNSVGHQWFNSNAVANLHDGWLIVPLSSHFAFSSPPLLVIVVPLLALIPLGLLLTIRRFPIRKSVVWYGGRQPRSTKNSGTTALTFSNALRTLYSAIYKPKSDVQKTFIGRGYVAKKVVFKEKVNLFFDSYLFKPIMVVFYVVANRLQRIQSGSLNLYNAIIGLLLILALFSVFL